MFIETSTPVFIETSFAVFVEIIAAMFNVYRDYHAVFLENILMHIKLL